MSVCELECVPLCVGCVRVFECEDGSPLEAVGLSAFVCEDVNVCSLFSHVYLTSAAVRFMLHP